MSFNQILQNEEIFSVYLLKEEKIKARIASVNGPLLMALLSTIHAFLASSGKRVLSFPHNSIHQQAG